MMNTTLMYTMSENYTFFLAALKVAENELDPPVDFLGEAYTDDFKSAFIKSVNEEHRPYEVNLGTLQVTFWGYVTKQEAEDEVYPCAKAGEAILHVSIDCHSDLGEWEARETTTGTLGDWYIPF